MHDRHDWERVRNERGRGGGSGAVNDDRNLCMIIGCHAGAGGGEGGLSLSIQIFLFLFFIYLYVREERLVFLLCSFTVLVDNAFSSLCIMVILAISYMKITGTIPFSANKKKRKRTRLQNSTLNITQFTIFPPWCTYSEG